jgi:hypothetical protein
MATFSLWSFMKLNVAIFVAAAVATAAQAQTTAPAAQTAPPKAAKVPAKKKPLAKPVAKAVVAPLEPATPEQIDAAGRVYYGVYECEFKQSIDVAINAQHPAYVDVKYGKAVYLMKPVLSSTGAIRLEDTKGETIVVQIAAKSMLMNVKAGQRMVDGCTTEKQREALEMEKQASAAEAAAAAAKLQAQATIEAAAAAASAASSGR